MACGGFGKAPQTGEAEGLLTSSGNVTHFSRGEEPWAGWADVAQMSLHSPTHTHRHTRARAPTPHAHFLLCLYFPLKYPQKENQWLRNFSRVSFGFVGVHRRELMWPSERGCSMTKGAVLVGHSGHICSYSIPSATLLPLCKVDVGKTKWCWAQENHWFASSACSIRLIS